MSGEGVGGGPGGRVGKARGGRTEGWGQRGKVCRGAGSGEEVRG